MATGKDWDTLISGALVFDGSGVGPQVQDIAIREGRIAERGSSLPAERAAEVIDGSGQWLMPGLLDIHTHLDLEVDLEPGLPEVVRHGTTTVVVGNCSLGTCFGKQHEGEQDPIVDCFTRVENIPEVSAAQVRGCRDLGQHRGLPGPFRRNSAGAQCRRLRAPFHVAGGGDGAAGQYQPGAHRR